MEAGYGQEKSKETCEEKGKESSKEKGEEESGQKEIRREKGGKKEPQEESS
jgi:hypothetical protein